MPGNYRNHKSNSIGHKNYAVAVENLRPYNTTGALDCFVVNMYLKCFLGCKCIMVFCSGAVKFRCSRDSSQTAEVIELLKLYPLSSWLISVFTAYCPKGRKMQLRWYLRIIYYVFQDDLQGQDHHYRYRWSTLWWPKDRTVNRSTHSCPSSHPMALALLPYTCLVVYLFLRPSSLCTCPSI